MLGDSNEPRIDRFEAIGTASLDEDGTLKLDLCRNFETRSNFHRILRISPDNPRYEEYIARIGGINPGERKPIPRW
jgi:hypothetical protein